VDDGATEGRGRPVNRDDRDFRPSGRVYDMRQAGDPIPRSMDSDYALEVWHRRKWVAVIVFLTAIVGVVSGTLALPDMYRTSATVLVARQQVSEAYVKTSVTTELETRIQTIQQQVMSRAALRDLIIALDLHPELGGNIPDSVIARMRRDVQLELKSVAQSFGRSTIAFTLTYSGRDPETVARVTNTLAGQYVEENISPDAAGRGEAAARRKRAARERVQAAPRRRTARSDARDAGRARACLYEAPHEQ
jgi:uncharacterized protein involved in exopolysaccharide biosynthesis